MGGACFVGNVPESRGRQCRHAKSYAIVKLNLLEKWSLGLHHRASLTSGSGGGREVDANGREGRKRGAERRKEGSLSSGHRGD